MLVRHAGDGAAAGMPGVWATRCVGALSTTLGRARLGRGDFTTEDTESTEKTEVEMEQDPFTGCIIGLLINFNVRRLADGIERFQL